MGYNQINLAFRFILEIAALLSLGRWGWRQTEGFMRYPLALGIPLIAAVIWGIFAVPDDQSRSGKTIVPTPGIIRLFLELAIFASGAWSLFATDALIFGWIFAAAVVIHYLISYDRVQWLIRH